MYLISILYVALYLQILFLFKNTCFYLCVCVYVSLLDFMWPPCTGIIFLNNYFRVSNLQDIALMASILSMVWEMKLNL